MDQYQSNDSAFGINDSLERQYYSY
jgi:hypothetical protein